jgi:arylsulfatase A-like enzyme
MHRLIFAILLAVTWLSHAQAQQPKAPNIVFILADDLGWTDLGSFGSKYYQTPNIDKLAAQGMKFTSAYTNGPNCAPTRACLMSGLYGPRHGIYTVGTGARGQEKDRKLVPVENNTTLDPSYMTLAETLRMAGYVTGHFGKWHLGAPGKAGPKEQGFDYNFAGNKSGSPQGGYFSPYKNPQLANGPKGEYQTDRLADEAVKFIQKHKDQKFFLYLPFYAVHTPLQAKEEIKAKYEKRKPIGGHRNPTYAAMIESLDQGVGRILQTLDDLGLAEDTIVIFTSDNGGVGGYTAAGILGALEITSQAPLRAGKGTLYEGGVRVPLIVRWPGVVKAGSVCPTPVITIDFYPTLADIAGAKKPAQLDGVNIVPLLKNPDADLGRKALYWHFPGYLEADIKKGIWRTTPAGSIRSGDWALIEFFEDGRLELYNLKDDIGQTKNLAASNPAMRDELHQMLVQWRKEVNAPMPKAK